MLKYFLLLFILLLSCEKDTSSISNTSNVPREYVWTLDTLTVDNLFQNMMYDIWGSSTKDVYAVGQSSGARGKMYHYEGKIWQPVKLHVVEGGPFPNIHQFWSIHGFSAENIYVAGSKNGATLNEFLSFFIHFDGQQWSEIEVYCKELLAVWGLSPSDLWIGGIEGTLLHFNGTSWNKFIIPDSIWIRSIKGFSTDNVYALAYSIGEFTRLTFYIFHWDGHTWYLQESYREIYEPERFGSHNLEVIEDYIYSVGYGGMFRKYRTDSVWDKIFNTELLYGLCGSSQENIFTVGKVGKAYHFNGIDWFQYKEIEFSSLEYSACWTDGKETFITGNNVSKSFVLHGR
jgi:hypothetical protein